MAAITHSLPFTIPARFVPDDLASVPLRTILVDSGDTLLDLSGLQSAGYKMFPVSGAEAVLRKLPISYPDLILIELSRQHSHGGPLIRSFREWTAAPVVIITDRNEESEKIACLELGADDYLTQPFSTRELIARLRAVTRRAATPQISQVFSSGDLKVNFTSRQVFVGGSEVKLSATEYELLKLLALQAGTVVHHQQLVEEIWGTANFQDSLHTLRVTMSKLRRKLTREPNTVWLISNEYGAGYRLRTDPDWNRATKRP